MSDKTLNLSVKFSHVLAVVLTMIGGTAYWGWRIGNIETNVEWLVRLQTKDIKERPAKAAFSNTIRQFMYSQTAANQRLTKGVLILNDNVNNVVYYVKHHDDYRASR